MKGPRQGRAALCRGEKRKSGENACLIGFCPLKRDPLQTIMFVLDGVVEDDMGHIATPVCMLVVSSCKRVPHYICDRSAPQWNSGPVVKASREQSMRPKGFHAALVLSHRRSSCLARGPTLCLPLQRALTCISYCSDPGNLPTTHLQIPNSTHHGVYSVEFVRQLAFDTMGQSNRAHGGLWPYGFLETFR